MLFLVCLLFIGLFDPTRHDGRRRRFIHLPLPHAQRHRQKVPRHHGQVPHRRAAHQGREQGDRQAGQDAERAVQGAAEELGRAQVFVGRRHAPRPLLPAVLALAGRADAALAGAQSDHDHWAGRQCGHVLAFACVQSER